jgi:3-phosphoshikimate 1-carboxyvinyltransferase
VQGGAYDGGAVNSCGDHRIAMAFAVASLRAKSTIAIDDCANVATSFPNFIELANTVGIKVEQEA